LGNSGPVFARLAREIEVTLLLAGSAVGLPVDRERRGESGDLIAAVIEFTNT
jgi:hypothetical protein